MTKQDKTNQIILECKGEEDRKRQTSKISLCPSVNAAMITKVTGDYFKADVTCLIKEMKSQAKKVTAGDMSAMEEMLVAQAYSMQSLFTYASNKAVSCKLLSQFEVYMKTAMKAQNQCRQTIAALSDLKNPKRTTFVKNTAHNQQVNFNSEKNESNELLNEANYAKVDTSPARAPSPAN